MRIEKTLSVPERETQERLLSVLEKRSEKKSGLFKVVDKIKSGVMRVLSMSEKKINQDSPQNKEMKKSIFVNTDKKQESKLSLSLPRRIGKQSGGGTDSVAANVTGSVIGAGVGAASSLGLSSAFLSLAGSTTKATTFFGFKVAESATVGSTFFSSLSLALAQPITIIGLGVLGGYLGYKYISKIFKR